MRSQKRILMLSPFFSPNLGGVETHLDDLTGYLSREGFPVTVISYKPLTTKGVKAELYENRGSLRIVRLPWIKFNLFYKLEKLPLLQFPYLFSGIFIFAVFYLLINHRKISTIHGHGLAAAVATLLLSKIFGIKGIVSLHTIYKFAERPALASVVSRLLRPLDRILVLARGCEDDLVKIGIPRDKIAVYTCWVDNIKSFYQRDTETCRKELGLPSGRFIALFIGRLSLEKGVSTVLETAKCMSGKGPIFIIVGDGPMSQEVKLAVSKDSNIIWVGNVANKSLKYYYGAADVLLFGSVDQDYYGRVTMEALSCGLPVILPDTTTYFGKEAKIKINFPDGEIGFMVSPTPESAASLLKKLYDNPEIVIKMSGSARVYALENFSEKNAEIFLNCYNQ